MIIATYSKEEDATTTYAIDWAEWLDGRTIASSSWGVPVGLVNEADSNTTTTTTIQLSGGTWGQSFTVTNTVTLNTADVEERSFVINIQQEQAYCTIAEVRRRAVQATEGTLTDAELAALIEEASRYFDLQCGVTPGYFNPSPYPVATERTFYGDGTHYLRVDSYVDGSITAVDLPAGYTAPDYVIRNGYLVRTGSDHVLPSTHRWGVWWPYGVWEEGIAVTIEAIWGVGSTPADVRMAVIELVINLWRETDPATLNLLDLERQPLRERLPPRVMEVVKKYRMNTSPAFV
jgi:hypothetical protein